MIVSIIPVAELGVAIVILTLPCHLRLQSYGLVYFLAATKQLYEWFTSSVCPSVCTSVHHNFLTMFPSSYHQAFLGVITNDRSDVRAKGQGQRSRSQRSTPNLAVSRLLFQFEFTYDDEMMHRAWCCLGEVPYCFLRSSVKFQGRTANKSSILTQIGRFWTVTPVWIHQWLWNDAQSLK